MFPSLLAGQLWGLLFLCCLMLPLLFSSSGESHSSKLAQSDIYWLIQIIWTAVYPDHLSLLPGRVNFLIRVLCFALWGAFQLLSFRTEAVLVKDVCGNRRLCCCFTDAWLELFCTHRLLEVDVSSNRLSTLPTGFLHLKNLKKLIASKNYMEKLFDEENSTYSPVFGLHFKADL